MALTRELVDGETKGPNVSGGNNSVTVPSGSNLHMFIGISYEDMNNGGAAPAVSSVVFNTSENASAISGAKASNFYGGNDYSVSEWWELDNPTVTTADVAVTMNTTVNRLEIIVIVYSDCNGAGSNTGTATGSSSNQTVSITTGASSSYILAQIHDSATGRTWTEVGTQVELYEYNSAHHSVWTGQQDATGGSDTVDPTESGSGKWSMAAIEVEEAAVGAGGEEFIPALLHQMMNHAQFTGGSIANFMSNIIGNVNIFPRIEGYLC